MIYAPSRQTGCAGGIRGCTFQGRSALNSQLQALTTKSPCGPSPPQLSFLTSPTTEFDPVRCNASLPAKSGGNYINSAQAFKLGLRPPGRGERACRSNLSALTTNMISGKAA